MNTEIVDLTQGTGAGTAGIGPGLDRSGHYHVQVLGALRPEWSAWFDGFELTPGHDEDGRPVTDLSGYVIDQAALHGLLNRIRDLGLSLLLVEQIDEDGALST